MLNSRKQTRTKAVPDICILLVSSNWNFDCLKIQYFRWNSQHTWKIHQPSKVTRKINYEETSVYLHSFKAVFLQVSIKIFCRQLLNRTFCPCTAPCRSTANATSTTTNPTSRSRPSSVQINNQNYVDQEGESEGDCMWVLPNAKLKIKHWWLENKAYLHISPKLIKICLHFSHFHQSIRDAHFTKESCHGSKITPCC